MKRVRTAISSAGILLLAAISFAAFAESGQEAQVEVSMEDFQALEGDGWEGSLNYLNYGSDKRSTIPVKMAIEISGKRSLQIAIRYPGEEEYNNSEKIKISRNGKRVDGYDLVARELQPDGVLLLTTLGSGRDDDRKADIQMVYFISANEFRIEKNVRFDQDDGFFNRNVYQFSR
ncbi:MAG: hypothetical protein HKN15_02200 [Xanthomonadales bacterium]|nr:hypothetical protein [Xanthomonadales bacterium]